MNTGGRKVVVELLVLLLPSPMEAKSENGNDFEIFSVAHKQKEHDMSYEPPSWRLPSL